MISKNSLVPILANKIPEFARDSYPNFVRYVRDYLEFLETDGNFLSIVNNWKDNIEPSLKVEPYIDMLLTDLGFVSGQSLAIDKNLLVHLLRDFYLSRGSESSFRFLFRILFNSDVTIRYPREQMLVPSNAEYGERHFIFTSIANIDSIDLQSLILFVRANGGMVEGLSSKTKAAIENIQILHGSGVPYLQIEILKPNTEFEVDEAVNILAGEFHITEFVKPILGLHIVSPGSGYMAGDTVVISGAKLNGAMSVESTINAGVTGITIANGGGGFQEGDIILGRSSDDGSGFSGRVSEVDVGGVITAAEVTNAGYNYTTIPQIFATRYDSANLVATSNKIGAIRAIKTVNPYVDFDEVAITVSSENGSGAVVETKKVSRWEIREWANRRGVLGENATLIDSDKIQQFSYTIISPIASTRYDDFVTEYLHPAGYIRSSSYEITSSVSLNIDVGDSVIGGSAPVSRAATLTTNFIPDSLIIETQTISTDLSEEIVTDLGEPILIV